jgi:putative ABC transport system permease protein
MARRNAGRAKGRTALIAVMVGLPVLAAVVLDVLIRSTVPTDATYLRVMLGDEAQARVRFVCEGVVVQDLRGDSRGCTLEEEQPAVGLLPEPGTSSGDLSTVVAEALPGVTLTPLRTGTVPLATALRSAGSVEYTEVDLTEPGVGGAFPLATGRLPAGPDEVLLRRSSADRLDVGPGDTVALGPRGEPALVVSGVLDTFAYGAEVVALPGAVPAALVGVDADASAFTWIVTGPTAVDWEDVLALNEVGFAVTSRAVMTDPPSREEVPSYPADLASTTVDVQGVVVGAAALGVGVLEAVLLIGPAFAVGARRSARELALLAANGAERRDLRRVVLWNGVVVGGGAAVAAGVLGIGLGAALVAVLQRYVGAFPNLVVPWLEVVAFVAGGTVIAVAAAWLPSRQASRVDVVAALSGRRSEASPRRGVPILGLVLLTAGGVMATAGAARSVVSLVLPGVLLLMVGMVSASGAVVTGLGRLARWAPLAPRLALRDAARQRGRTAPAVAAVIAAVAGAVAGAVFFASGHQRSENMWTPTAALGTVQIGLPPGDRTAAEQTGLVADAVAATDAVAPLATSATVRMVVPTDPVLRDAWVYLFAVLPVENQCPLSVEAGVSLSAAEVAEYADDARCAGVTSAAFRSVWTTAGPMTPLVDDGSAIELIDLPGAGEAAAALAGGAVLVADELSLWPDGTAHITVDHTVDGEQVLSELVFPGHATGWPNPLYSVVLPETAMDDLAALGLTTQDVGAVARPVEPLSPEQVDTARLAVTQVHPDGAVEVEEPYRSPTDLTTVFVVGAAALVALAATWIAVGLAAAESRADMATLAAVGAAPRTRRKVAGAQAGVIAATGVVLGSGVGALLGIVFVQVQAAAGTRWPDPSWQVVVPWGVLAAVVIGLPTTAAGAAALCTRSRLPLVRRIAT